MLFFFFNNFQVRLGDRENIDILKELAFTEHYLTGKKYQNKNSELILFENAPLMLFCLESFCASDNWWAETAVKHQNLVKCHSWPNSPMPPLSHVAQMVWARIPCGWYWRGGVCNMADIEEVVCATWLSQRSRSLLCVACPTAHHEHHIVDKWNTKSREHFQTKSLVLRFYFNVFTCKTKPVLRSGINKVQFPFLWFTIHIYFLLKFMYLQN